MAVQLPKGVTEASLAASVCLDSFFDFCQEFWEVIVPETPVWNWHLDYLCYIAQKSAERVFAGLPRLHDIIINICPGSTKSTIFSIMLPAWCWARMPSFRFIGVSYAYSLSMDLARKTRDIIKSDKYQKYFPWVKIRSDQDSKGYFISTKGGMRIAVGVDGLITGFHGHMIVVDDPLNPKQAASELDLKAANAYLSETLPSRRINRAIVPTILVMQRLAEHDPTAERLAKKDRIPVKQICIPAELTEDVQPKKLRKYYRDGLMDPVRLGWPALKEAMAEGEYSYASQYLQNPKPRGGGFFKTDKMQIGIPPSQWAIVVRGWDKAGTAGGGDYTVGVKIGKDLEGRFWILDVVRGQWDSFTRNRQIRRTAEEDTSNTIIAIEVEPGSGGKESGENSIRELAGYIVRTWKVGASDGDKIKRADSFSVQVNGGNVWLAKGDWNRDFLNELSYFPFSRHDDQVDASSTAFWGLTRPMLRVGGLFTSESYSSTSRQGVLAT